MLNRETQIKTKKRYQYATIRTAKIRKTDDAKSGLRCRKSELSSTRTVVLDNVLAINIYQFHF